MIKPDRYADLRALARKNLGLEIDDEFAAHLSFRVDALIADGMTPDEAKREALRRFGDREEYRRSTLAVDEAARRRTRWFHAHDAFSREFGAAFRRLSRQPTFTASTALGLGLGLAATTILFALVNSVILAPLPFPHGDRLVHISHPVPGIAVGQRWPVSVAGYFQFRAQARSFDALGAYARDRVPLFSNGETQEVGAVLADAALTRLLGLKPTLGRLFRDEEARPGSASVAILSFALWQRSFGSDSAIVGKRIEIGGNQTEVIGVLADGVDFPGQHAELWLPFVLDSTDTPRNSHYVRVIGRLAPHATVESAMQELRGIVAQFVERFPSAYSPNFMTSSGFGVDVRLWTHELAGPARQILWTLLGAMLVLLLVALANVGNLLVARYESRLRDVTVRLALGAERSHLALYYLAESTVIATLATLLAIAITIIALPVVVRTAPFDIARLRDTTINPSVFAALAGLGFVVAWLLSIIPISRLKHADLRRIEGGRGASVGPTRARLRSTLVVTQVAFSLILLAGAGLLLRSGAKLRAVPLGFVPTGLTTFRLSLPNSEFGSDYAKTLEFHRAFQERLRTLSGVRAVGASQVLPLSDFDGCSNVFVEGSPIAPGGTPPCVASFMISPDYFSAIQIPVRGRSRSWADELSRSNGVVVSASLARRLWPGQEALGRGLRPNGADGPYYRVIGVAGDIRTVGLDQPPLDAIYYPLMPAPGAPLWSPATSIHVVVQRDEAGLTAFARALSGALADLNPRVAVDNVHPMQDLVDAALARSDFVLQLLTAASTLALLIAAIGLFGMVSFGVEQRMRELGIRSALGATRRQLHTMIIGQSARLTLLGVAVGVMGTGVLTGTMRHLLFGVSPFDPMTIGLAAAALIAVAIIAATPPAIRAGRASAATILREE